MPEFYSPVYLQAYTDGYGYDFYYGGYGLYEYSKMPVKPALWTDDSNTSLFILIGVMVGAFCVCCISLSVSNLMCADDVSN